MSNFFEKYSQIVGQDKVDKIIQEGKIIGQIKSRRMEIGLTQNDLAELIEVPKSTIGRIEAGLTSPRTDTLMKISRALNIPLIIDGRAQQLDKPSVEISLEYTISNAKIENDRCDEVAELNTDTHDDLARFSLGIFFWRFFMGFCVFLE